MLDRLDESGEEWSEHEATADIMLAMDRDDIQAYRYYAERWEWSKSRVYRHMDTLKERARQWRSFNRSKWRKSLKNGQERDTSGTERDTSGTRAGHQRDKIPDSAPFEAESETWAGHQRDTSGTSAGHQRDNIEQSTEQSTDTHSHTARVREGPDPVEVYTDIMPRRPNNVQKNLMRQKVEDCDRWRSVLLDWRGNGWSPKSVTKMIDRYEQQNGRDHDGDRTNGRDGDGEWALTENPDVGQ
jgi:hypothetical protein